jgi:hypothetical protein
MAVLAKATKSAPNSVWAAIWTEPQAIRASYGAMATRDSCAKCGRRHGYGIVAAASTNIGVLLRDPI